MFTRVRALLRFSPFKLLERTNPTRNPGCAEFEVDNWALSRFILRKVIPVVGAHPFPLNELMLMCAAICRLEPSEVFEWGTHVGKSARVFYECARHYRIPLDVHSVDLPDDAAHVEHPHHMRGKLVRGLPNVHLYQGDGIDTSLSIWRKTGRRPAPLFYIDGDHSFESVRRELSAIASEVDDANILLHDAFYQSPESAYNVGPHRAIEGLLEAYPGRYRSISSGLGLPGMTLLYQLR